MGRRYQAIRKHHTYPLKECHSDLYGRQLGIIITLVGQYYMDEGLLYKTIRAVVRRGLIVGFRFLKTGGKVPVEGTPIRFPVIQSVEATKKSSIHDYGVRRL